MSQENNPNTVAEATSKPDFAACCQEMAGKMSDWGPTMERMMSACGPTIERRQAACCERSQEPEPVDGDTDNADA